MKCITPLTIIQQSTLFFASCSSHQLPCRRWSDAIFIVMTMNTTICCSQMHHYNTAVIDRGIMISSQQSNNNSLQYIKQQYTKYETVLRGGTNIERGLYEKVIAVGGLEYKMQQSICRCSYCLGRGI